MRFILVSIALLFSLPLFSQNCKSCDSLDLLAKQADYEAYKLWWKKCTKADSIFVNDQEYPVAKENATRVRHYFRELCSPNYHYALTSLDNKYIFKSYELNESDTIYRKADTAAVFPGGEEKMLKYIAKNLKYPPESIKKKVSGKIYAQFVIDEKGKIVNSYVMKGLDKLCNEAALKVIRSMPAWKPAVVEGRRVKMLFTLPISLKL